LTRIGGGEMGAGAGHARDAGREREAAPGGPHGVGSIGGRRVSLCLAPAVLAACCEWQHNDAMPTAITIRDVPDETRDELAARAASSGRSLQEYLRSQLIELARRPDAEVL